MRVYRLTNTGRRVAKEPTQKRDPLLDELYPRREVPYETLLAVVGQHELPSLLRSDQKLGDVEEVKGNGTFY